MPAITTTVTKTVAVELSATLKRKLLNELKAYQALKTELDAIIEAMNEHKATIGALQEESGEANLLVDGFRVALVSPVRATLDKKNLLLAGVSMSQIENATVLKPTKPYTKISCPGEPDATTSSGTMIAHTIHR